MIRICFHGAESTGKSTLAAKLAEDFGCPLVAEYGREHAETIGIRFGRDELLDIAAEQDRRAREAAGAAAARGATMILFDTDPLMTAAWARMLLGAVPDALMAYPKADLYLLFAPDVPWVEDGTRFFGTGEARAEFAQAAHDMLVYAGVPYRPIAGDWKAREAAARAAIAECVA